MMETNWMSGGLAGEDNKAKKDDKGKLPHYSGRWRAATNAEDRLEKADRACLVAMCMMTPKEKDLA